LVLEKAGWPSACESGLSRDRLLAAAGKIADESPNTIQVTEQKQIMVRKGRKGRKGRKEERRQMSE
jgi:hypothetical protein